MYEVDDIMSIDFGKSEISVKTLFFEQTKQIIGNIWKNPELLEMKQ